MPEPTAADLAEFYAWKAQQDMPAVVDEPVTIADVLIALVHAARLPNEEIVRKYIAVIRDAEEKANLIPAPIEDTEGSHHQ